MLRQLQASFMHFWMNFQAEKARGLRRLPNAQRLSFLELALLQ